MDSTANSNYGNDGTLPIGRTEYGANWLSPRKKDEDIRIALREIKATLKRIETVLQQ